MTHNRYAIHPEYFFVSKMAQNSDFQSASSSAVMAMLGRRLDALRLAQNVSQAELAEQAGVSRSTIARIAEGRGVSLDSFVRVMQALGLGSHLGALLPDPTIRPVERVRYAGRERQRASGKRQPSPSWRWGDEQDET